MEFNYFEHKMGLYKVAVGIRILDLDLTPMKAVHRWPQAPDGLQIIAKATCKLLKGILKFVEKVLP